MTSKLCRYGCGTQLEGFDEEQRKFLEAGTGGLHTKERCQEAKAKLAQKNDHGNESYSPKVDVQLPPEQTLYPTKTEYVDHTLKGQSKVAIIFSDLPSDVQEDYNKFLADNQGKIKTQGAQFQMDNGKFAIALYYEEVAKQ